MKLNNISQYRTDISPKDEFLQVSARKLQINTIVKEHKHLNVDRKCSTITQESWLIIKGQIKGTFYDLDDTIIGTEILEDGDCAVLFRGGHRLEVLKEDSIFYEFKTGPYLGNDKKQI
jgi:hypothetical protein